ncbi:alpha/beta hydrolase [Phytohabitans kaempferiae]|uniref:Alpha/beta hydrolase n=1 Tax=Phytohabitans kaempferiae TaxID=1620943 RepID=A0ABV6M3S4_9ACTN
MTTATPPRRQGANVKSRNVHFYSDGLRLEGIVHMPDDLKDGERRPAVMVCHGRLAIKEWVPSRWVPYLTEAGYVCLAFDYRNLGTSEGTLGTIIPQDEVRDIRHALTFFQQQPEVDPDRIGILGWGLGGGVVIAAAAEDERLKAVVCAGGIVDGYRYGRDNMTYREWLDRMKAIEEDRVTRVLTGKSGYLDKAEFPSGNAKADAHTTRYGYRQSLASVVGEERASDPKKLGIPEALTIESMEALYNFRPTESIDKIAPRPLLVVHARDDEHFPFDHLTEMFERAGEPKTFITVEEGTHLSWIDPSQPEQKIYVPKVVDWIRDNLC